VSAEAITLALAGDTMLGRAVAESLERDPRRPLFAEEVVDVAREADLFLLNLECCISERGSRWPSRHKPFFFRAPPRAVETLVHLGVDCVTLANNHALDYGEEALLDTFEHLRSAGIAWVGAGRDDVEADAPRVLEASGFRLGVLALSSHPHDFAARPGRPGIAFCDLRESGVSDGLRARVADLRSADAVLVTPHWGPNMTTEPVPYVREAGDALREAGATLIAGHSAHVFHGVADRILYDLGDFIDDYRVDPALRNDLGLIFLVTLDGEGVRRIEAVPLALDFCHTRLAQGHEVDWIVRRLERACAALGTAVAREEGRFLISPRSATHSEPGPE
jgi:poly-gamma-glutamate synthesis protein (capsule biosynthesis protein)